MYTRKRIPYKRTPTGRCVEPKRCGGIFCTNNSSHIGIIWCQGSLLAGYDRSALVVGGFVQTLNDSQSLRASQRIMRHAFVHSRPSAKRRCGCKESSRYGSTVMHQGMNGLCGRYIVVRQITEVLLIMNFRYSVRSVRQEFSQGISSIQDSSPANKSAGSCVARIVPRDTTM